MMRDLLDAVCQRPEGRTMVVVTTTVFVVYASEEDAPDDRILKAFSRRLSIAGLPGLHSARMGDNSDIVRQRTHRARDDNAKSSTGM